ncbi:hypothetical protein C5167_023119 [Papaver somniferum]|uniref:Uncharacterized protein n=1 Tax=Papaver somniferum TaxID=3469 RepID=A0A4Y7JLD0_PAPSO|nr:hypothetical protein C5167_023119 [Papaver somniferum]
MHLHDPLSPTVLDEGIVKVDTPHSIVAQGWSLERNRQHKDNGDSQAVFNALETVLKDSLERLKTRRHVD